MNTNPKETAGSKKAPLHLVPAALLEETSVALMEGIQKGYGRQNWRYSNVHATTYHAAILRHLAAWGEGEDVDPDSSNGKTHLGAIAASVAILLDAARHGTLVDDRVVRVPDSIPPDIPFPALPTGYTVWKYRGGFWKPDAVVWYSVFVAIDGGSWSAPRLGVPSGTELHYIEAIKTSP